LSIHIQLNSFEGPLALLLYLIRKEEMDIMDINVHLITRQYFEYIKKMKELDLEVAGEFIAMAATLIQIKSKMLLPQYNEDGEVIEDADPRRQLVQKLLEYQMYQDASKNLYDRPLLGRDIWVRGRRETIEADKDDEVEVEENPLFSLIKSYRHVISQIKKKSHRVVTELQSIAERILEIKSYLQVGKSVLFQDLMKEKSGNDNNTTQNQILVTFLSLLELGKLGFVSLFQSEPLGDIYIKAKAEITGDVVNDVEEYDDLDNKDDFKTQSEIDNFEDDDASEDSPEITASKNFIQPDEVIDETATDEEILLEEQKLNLNPLEI
jgi:segregation and condensation protein A